MSTELTVLTVPTEDPAVFRVNWAAGIRTQGVVDVKVSCAMQDKELIAELAATQHLLEVLEVCSKDRTGNNLSISISHAALRKLARGRSAKNHLAPFALFLRTRFADANLVVSKATSFINPARAELHRTELVVSHAEPSWIKLRDGSKLHVTAHALERFRDRFSFARSCDAWRELRSCAMHSALVPSKVTVSEEMEFGSNVRAYDAYNGARLIVKTEDGLPMLLTAYWHGRSQSNYQSSWQSVA